MSILLLVALNIVSRFREWRGRHADPHALLTERLDGEPKRYEVTQPAKPIKARLTWEKAMRIYLATRKGAA